MLMLVSELEVEADACSARSASIARDFPAIVASMKEVLGSVWYNEGRWKFASVEQQHGPGICDISHTFLLGCVEEMWIWGPSLPSNVMAGLRHHWK